MISLKWKSKAKVNPFRIYTVIGGVTSISFVFWRLRDWTQAGLYPAMCPFTTWLLSVFTVPTNSSVHIGGQLCTSGNG